MAGKIADTVVVGAGLSGLAAARQLLAQGRKVVLLEARQRTGGRILSLAGSGSGAHRYDLGPAWVWPHNTHVLRLTKELGLPLMRQYANGNLVFQDKGGDIRRDLAFATMGDALRIPDGLARLTDRLAEDLPEGVLHLQHVVTRIEALSTGVRLCASHAHGDFEITARHVVLSLPPRLATAHIAFDPPLPVDVLQRLESTPTWMAGHAKLVAVYEKAFWRQAGLSGDAISHLGPLFEIHDACPNAEAAGEAALFGFVTPHRGGKNVDTHRLKREAIAQLVALFGPQASTPALVHVVNWASEPFTATSLDRPDLADHPLYGAVDLEQVPWAGRLLFSGTETAPENGGFLEGALEAAAIAASNITRATGQSG